MRASHRHLERVFFPNELCGSDSLLVYFVDFVSREFSLGESDLVACGECFVKERSEADETNSKYDAREDEPLPLSCFLHLFAFVANTLRILLLLIPFQMWDTAEEVGGRIFI